MRGMTCRVIASVPSLHFEEVTPHRSAHRVRSCPPRCRRARCRSHSAALATSADVTVEKLDITSTDVAKAAGWDIDVLINNAGAGQTGPMADVPIDRVRRLFEVNVFGTLAVTQRVLPRMVTSRRPNAGQAAAHALSPRTAAWAVTSPSPAAERVRTRTGRPCPGRPSGAPRLPARRRRARRDVGHRSRPTSVALVDHDPALEQDAAQAAGEASPAGRSRHRA